MKKFLKPVIMSSLMAAAFGALSVSTTFALFTSKAEAEIEVGSGKLQISSNVADLKTYSCEVNTTGDRIDENNHHYISKETEVNGVFTNTGTASAENSVVKLERMTPGDRVTFKVNLGDNSNIDYKYRVVYKLVSQDEKLAKALVTTTDMGGEEKSFEGLLEYVSTWVRVSEKALPSSGISFDIELPIFKGNEYQDKEAEFAFTVEAVQGNAYTDNEGAKIIEGIEDISAEAKAVADQDVTLRAASYDESIAVKTVIPAEAEEVSAGDKVELLVQDMDIGTTTGGEATFNFDIVLKVNDVVTSSFSEEIAVEIYVGENLDVKQVFHDGVLIPASDYVYNEQTGIISFSTSHFSPFKVIYQLPIGPIGGESMIDDGEEF